MFRYIPVLLVCILLGVSCATTKDIAYFQDVGPADEKMDIQNDYVNIIRSGDILSIIVSSSKPELATPYNLYGVRTQMSGSSNTTYRPEMEGYTVDQYGNIDFPVLGYIRVAGMTRQQLAEFLKERLKDVVPNPVITVSFLNFKVTVLGEVNKPGPVYVQGDRLTLLEAIGAAGDLTIYGRRTNILIIRETNGVRQAYRLDLKTKNLFESPYFYLQQNDIVYVEPINAKAQSISGFRMNFPTIASIGSILTSIAMVIFYFSRS